MKVFFTIILFIFVLIQTSCTGNITNIGNVSEYENYKDSIDEVKEIYLSADDPENPLNVFRVPITKEIVKVSEEILHGKKDLTPHQKIVLFMNFFNDFKVGIASDMTPETTIRERTGACGSFTNTVLALAATQKIEGRVISLANYPINDGHAVAEFFINDKWQLYDPTYASYYTNTPDNIINPNVLSFEELKAGKGHFSDVVRIIGNQKRLEIGLPLSDSFAGPDIYEKANPAGPIGPDKPFIYPLALDFSNNTKLEKKDFSAKNQGSSYIGAAGINNFQQWSLTSLSPGKRYKFVVIPDSIGGEMVKFENNFYATASIISGGKINKGNTVSLPINNKNLEQWEIHFTADSDIVQLLIEHPYRGPKFHYLTVKGYYLED